jgi:hypothetical protein
MNPSTRPTTPPLVLWIIWFAIICSIVLYQFKLGHGLLTGSDARPASQNPVMLLAVGLIVVALLLRWLLMPKMKDARQQLILMIIGLSLSEAIGFYGIFFFGPDMPSTKMTLFAVSLLSALQFAPVYAKQGNADGQNG